MFDHLLARTSIASSSALMILHVLHDISALAIEGQRQSHLSGSTCVVTV